MASNAQGYVQKLSLLIGSINQQMFAKSLIDGIHKARDAYLANYEKKHKYTYTSPFQQIPGMDDFIQFNKVLNDNAAKKIAL